MCFHAYNWVSALRTIYLFFYLPFSSCLLQQAPGNSPGLELPRYVNVWRERCWPCCDGLHCGPGRASPIPHSTGGLQITIPAATTDGRSVLVWLGLGRWLEHDFHHNTWGWVTTATTTTDLGWQEQELHVSIFLNYFQLSMTFFEWLLYRYFQQKPEKEILNKLSRNYFPTFWTVLPF